MTGGQGMRQRCPPCSSRALPLLRRVPCSGSPPSWSCSAAARGLPSEWCAPWLSARTQQPAAPPLCGPPALMRAPLRGKLAFLYCSCSCSCLQLCASALAASVAAAAAFSACHAHALHQWDNSGNTMPLCMRLDISHCSDCMHAASRQCDSVPTLQHWPGDTLVSSYEECPLHKGQVKVREVLNTIGRRRGSLYH